jgi:hypothetical protein
MTLSCLRPKEWQFFTLRPEILWIQSQRTTNEHLILSLSIRTTLFKDTVDSPVNAFWDIAFGPLDIDDCIAYNSNTDDLF